MDITTLKAYVHTAWLQHDQHIAVVTTERGEVIPAIYVTSNGHWLELSDERTEIGYLDRIRPRGWKHEERIVSITGINAQHIKDPSVPVR